jgi:hypothetical protein
MRRLDFPTISHAILLREEKVEHSPFLQDHEQALEEQGLGQPRSEALPQTEEALVLDDVGEDLAEGAERLALPGRRRLGHEGDFGDDDGMGDQCREAF